MLSLLGHRDIPNLMCLSLSGKHKQQTYTHSLVNYNHKA